MKSKLPVSVIICALNEEKNIGACLESVIKNNPQQIIVVDGSSTDKTREIAKLKGAKVIKMEKGLAGQRQAGIIVSTQPYVAFVDADDHLDSKCFDRLLNELNKNDYAAIQAQTLSWHPKTFWEKAMDLNLKMFINKPGPTNMVGRPALYKKSVFQKVKFDKTFNFGSEDTDISRAIEKAGLKQGIGTGISYRKHLESLSECLKQWAKYGEGDGKFINKNPDRVGNMTYHLLINYSILKPIKLILNGKGEYSPFFILQGLVRFGFMVKTLIKLQLQ